MMKATMIKDQLILLCVHPEKGWMRKRSVITYAVVAAAMFDLALSGKLLIQSGRIEAEPTETGDPLLDELSRKLAGSNGKRFSWMMSGMSPRIGKYYRIQVKYLESSRMLSSMPVEWMGIKWGKRYRVNRSDSLKPLINQMDRVLIYGRKAGLELRLLIELLGMLGVLSSFFPDGELKKRAIQRFKSIASEPYGEYSETLKAIQREFRNTLRMNNVS